MDKQIMSPEVAGFIANYTPDKKAKIAFAWDRKYSDTYNDPNMDFRIKVIDAVVENPELAPLNLVKDLYIAETECVNGVMGIYPKIRFLAEILLNRGGLVYLEIFLDRRWGSFDTYCETAQVKLSKETAIKLAQECQRLANSTESDYEQLLYQKGRKFFEWKAEVAK